MSAALGASSCTAAIAACSWYGPSGGAPEHAAEERDALGDQRMVPARRGPARRAARARRRRPCARRARASVSSMSASRPVTSPSSGRLRCSIRVQPDRLGGEVGALQVVARRRRVPLVEHEVEHLQDDAQPLGDARRRAGGGTSAPAVLIDCLARLMRWAIVASGTRNAVRDLGGGEAADRAQRQRELRRRRQRRVAAQEEQGERVVVRARSASAHEPLDRDRRRSPRVDGARSSPRSWSISRRVATVVSHAGGLIGTTLLGPLHRRREQRLLHRVLGGVEVAVATHQRAEDLRRELAQQVLGRRCRWLTRCPAPRASAGAPRPGRAGRTAPGPRSRARARGCRRR